MSFPVAILAGGLATRLRPITESIPKAILDVAGQPFIIRQLHYLRHQGVTEVVLCLGHLGDQIQAIVADGAALGLSVRYSWDGPILLGTGGALRKALPLLGQTFYVFYGDSYLPIDFRAVAEDFLARRKPALMTVLKNRDEWDKSNVLFRDGRIVEYNKRRPTSDMAHIDYGLGILSASVLEHVPLDAHLDLSDLYHDLSLRDELAGYEVSERFYEIGSPTGLSAAIEYFNKGM